MQFKAITFHKRGSVMWTCGRQNYNISSKFHNSLVSVVLPIFILKLLLEDTSIVGTTLIYKSTSIHTEERNKIKRRRESGERETINVQDRTWSVKWIDRTSVRVTRWRSDGRGCRRVCPPAACSRAPDRRARAPAEMDRPINRHTNLNDTLALYCAVHAFGLGAVN